MYYSFYASNTQIQRIIDSIIAARDADARRGIAQQLGPFLTQPEHVLNSKEVEEVFKPVVVMDELSK